jgi:methionine synthase I (cobalamin-dependent)
MYVLDEALEAIRASRDHGLYTLACMTFNPSPNGFKTMYEMPLAEAVAGLDASGADVIGTNCGNGIEDMVAIAREMRKLTRKPLIVKSNAGIPEVVDGKIIYHETPEMMAERIAELREIGVSIVGGCCGTTPEHIRTFRRHIDAQKSRR